MAHRQRLVEVVAELQHLDRVRYAAVLQRLVEAAGKLEEAQAARLCAFGSVMLNRPGALQYSTTSHCVPSSTLTARIIRSNSSSLSLPLSPSDSSSLLTADLLSACCWLPWSGVAAMVSCLEGMPQSQPSSQSRTRRSI